MLISLAWTLLLVSFTNIFINDGEAYVHKPLTFGGLRGVHQVSSRNIKRTEGIHSRLTELSDTLSLFDSQLFTFNEEHACRSLTVRSEINVDSFKLFSRIACNLIRFSGRLIGSCLQSLLNCDPVGDQIEEGNESSMNVQALVQPVNIPSPVDENWMHERRRRRGMRPVSVSEYASFDPRNIQIAARMSSAAYHDSISLASTASLIPAGGAMPKYISSHPSHGAQALLWQHVESRTLFIAFRGTTSMTDLRHDLDFRMVPYTSGDSRILVHAGFRDKLKSIEHTLQEEVGKSLTEIDRIILTGHSLGGALATLASPLLAEKFPSISIQCISFGSPRVGNRAFSHWFNAKLHSNLRLANDFDQVPNLPFETFYEHVGPAISLSDENEILVVPEVPIGSRFSNALEDLDMDRLMYAHDMHTYIRRVDSSFNSKL
jgi:hypothetical protein